MRMAHRIMEGADVAMMPSRFEPCGLKQLYVILYWKVPLVHVVGVWRDTIPPFDPYSERGLEWASERTKVNMMIDALRNCLKTHGKYKVKYWLKCMHEPLSSFMQPRREYPRF
ncbi:hypothetical protein KSP39_PZI007834 [Platanthera zijinensis]|uniref:Glycosyltransferase n=1 Tax=Platanthera zijinensis TaxID=2320716 RepID=A0AAP0BMW6_9ASPA